jgi:hypothetical protein
MSSLHRDKRATNNFYVIWKVREGSGPNRRRNRLGSQAGAQAPGWPPSPPSQSGSVSWIAPPPPLRMNNNRRSGRFDPMAMVLRKGLYKQGP